ncbi:MAG: hypothetical protein JL50_02950 [Peptococcaceae bacterium BICA1-7]|nr:MAG: hypothetical protein JL50_02950 [Peptococcaceae bacterium BICA1-7]HBV97777.1 hypothetical protein [Desulfotomaculum sp.]
MAGGVVISGERELFARLSQIGIELAGPAKKKALMAGAEIVKQEAEARANGDPGIAIKIEDSTALIGPDKRHWKWRFIEYGVGSHLIRPKRKEVLANKSAGEFFGEKVNHPGIAKKPFLRPALDENEDRIRQAIREELARVLR